MVFTRSQTSKSNQTEPENMEVSSDNECDITPEGNTRGATNNIERAKRERICRILKEIKNYIDMNKDSCK